mmetsp:Transcript_15341/g.44391  ORF Transcript_15341/g.44391 Transcript_15341/m.44391 type:complete len:493 (-) Transcript_15341:156-1634(-)
MYADNDLSSAGGGHPDGSEAEAEAEVNQLLALDKNLSAPFQNHAIQKLDLFQCNLSSLPSSLPEVLPNLSILFCMKNKFTEMPAVIGQCPRLQMVSFKSNEMTSIHPEALQPQMRWLILTDNRLESLPSTIGRCTDLQKCMLSGNLLTALPDEIENCKSLELIRLASNKLEEPPIKLLSLPSLSWVAFSDNPFLFNLPASTRKLADKAAAELRTLDDPELDDPNVGEVLGTGASGITHRKYHQNDHVAVKTYVGHITSDGNPEEERKISMLASSLGCDFLIQVLGQTAGSGALVMEYLENYSALADPPSMDSCSRDVYPDDAAITPDDAVDIVSGLLDALAKLHAAGVCHGDFYGHNILIPPPGSSGNKVKLSDMGAAFMYNKRKKYGGLIEVIEKRAFARLVTEICSLLVKSDDPDAREASKLLADLSHICLASSLDTFEFLNLKWQGLQSWYKEGRASKVEAEKAGEDAKQTQRREVIKKKKSQRRLTLV